MNNTQRFLSIVMNNRWERICEPLGGFRNEWWQTLTSGSGELRMFGDSPDMGIYIIRNAWFDFDYEEALLVQVWDHEADDSEWQYLLLFNSGANEWVPEMIAVWTTHPKLSDVGDTIDNFFEARYRSSRQEM